MIALLAAAIGSASAEPANFHQTYSVHPLLLPFGQYQVSGEWRTADKVGVMVSPTFIRVVDFQPSGSDELVDFLGVTCTLQGRYYVLGTFSKGLFVGGAGGGGFLSVTTEIDEQDAKYTNAVVVAGPVLGGKLGFPVGLTLDADIGLLLGQSVSSATVGTTTAPGTSTFRAQPILEVRAGWSF
jgi:hypothetical protein